MASTSSPMAQSQGKLFLQKTSKEGGTPEHIDWQMEHRLELVSYWDIKPGSRVLEIGCGQGDCTIVLADQVGEKGHVDAVDPGAPDYGTLSTPKFKLYKGLHRPQVHPTPSPNPNPTSSPAPSVPESHSTQPSPSISSPPSPPPITHTITSS